MKPSRLLPLATVLALVSVATACSSGSDNTAPTSSSSSQKTITTLNGPPQTVTTVDGSHVGDPCTFLDKAAVKHLFDNTAGKVTSKSGPIINGMSCTLSLHTPSIDYALVESIQEGNGTYGEKYVLNAKHLDGLGETAYVARHTIGGGLIVSFVRDGRTYTFTYAKSGDVASHPDPSDQVDELVAMIRAGIARLP